MPNHRVPARRGLVFLATLIVAACGAQPSTPPPSVTASPGTPTGTAAASGDPAFAAMLADAIANAGQPAGDIGDDLDRGELLIAMGVPAALGADADKILALVAASEVAARSQQPFPAGPGPTSLRVPDGAFADAADPELILAAFKKFHGISNEFRDYMVGTVKAIGFEGAQTSHFDLGTVSNTQKEGALTATTQMHSTIDAVFTGSVAKATFDTDIHNTVTDTTTGSTAFTETVRLTTTGELDACPSAAGLVPASFDRSSDEDATTFPGADGRGGSHATGHRASSSQFQGTTDDTATLGRVSQTYTHDEKFKQTASADGPPTKEGAMSFGLSGINDGVPTNNDSIGARFGDWSGATQTKAELSGDATQNLIDRLPFEAGYDWATMEASYFAAQEVWRDSRCVIVTAPGYIPASEFRFNRKPTHTEEVDKGSTTQFEVGLDHRYKQPVTAKITAKLDGKESLSPDAIPKPPGQLTYVAPDQNGTERQGAARIDLATGDRPAHTHVPDGDHEAQGVDRRHDDLDRRRHLVHDDPARLEHPADQDGGPT